MRKVNTWSHRIIALNNDINFMAASYFIIMINMVYRDMMSQLKSASVHYGFRI